MKELVVLSLFDGMGCLRQALDRVGAGVKTYYASEIDEHAMRVVNYHYPDTIQLGDIEGWREWNIDWASIDLIGGGSPCQGFSSAGKGLAFDDPRSRLFFAFLDIVNHVKSVSPNVKFLLENVKMKKSYQDAISDRLGCQPVFINSSLVSAQSRQRLYWANWDFDEPMDRGVTMADIIDGDYYSTRDKSYCIDANYGKGTNFRRYFFMGSRQLVLENGYTPTGMTKESANQIMNDDGRRFRILTPEECEKLQTVPVGYTVGAPRQQRYKMLGNGWTVDVIAHILKPVFGN